MDLLCCEVDCVKRAYEDPVLLQDDRVLQNLLTIEDKYLASANYYKCVQTEIEPFMRKMVSNWMLQVSFRRYCVGRVLRCDSAHLTGRPADRAVSVCAANKYSS